MPANILGSRFYSFREKPWHSYGEVSDTETSAKELFEKWGGYTFEKRAAVTTLNGQEVVIGFTLVRSPVKEDLKEVNFGLVAENYKILQPERIAELFDESVGLPVETMGSLRQGERMFITWKLNTIEPKVSDTIILYGMIAAGFDGLMGTSLNVVAQRTVCENTFMAALREAKQSKEKGRGIIWSGRHNSTNLERDFGAWMKFVKDESCRKQELVEEFFSKIVKIPLEKKDDVYSLLFKAYPDPEPLGDCPPELRKESVAKLDEKAEKMEKIRDGVYHVFNTAGTEITPDYYGLFNASSEYFTWGQPSKKDTEYSILFGNRANNVNAMANVLWAEVNK